MTVQIGWLAHHAALRNADCSGFFSRTIGTDDLAAGTNLGVEDVSGTYNGRPIDPDRPFDTEAVASRPAKVLLARSTAPEALVDRCGTGTSCISSGFLRDRDVWAELARYRPNPWPVARAFRHFDFLQILRLAVVRSILSSQTRHWCRLKLP